ncbi:MAG: hypothetical protein ACR2J8_10025, partial [Thermomicrobiales bacterium]
YCLIPVKAVCDDDMDCTSRDCPGGTCVACSHIACIEPCVPTVCKTCLRKTIQSAIDHAANDDVIIIDAGYYIEDLVVDKNITLRACRGKPVTIQNKTYNTRTISVTNAGNLALIDITVEALADPANGNYGGGISSFGNIGLFRYSVVTSGAWPIGGGILLGGIDLPSAAFERLTDKDEAPLSTSIKLPAPPVPAPFSDAATITPEAIYTRYVIIADQSAVAANTADSYGGGIYAGFSFTVCGPSDEPRGCFATPPTTGVSALVALVGDVVVRDNRTITQRIAQQGRLIPARSAIGSGGGIAIVNGALYMFDGRVTGNAADNGAGGGVSIVNETLAFSPGTAYLVNSARVDHNPGPIGGGISIRTSTSVNANYINYALMVGSVSISNNTADSYGGGVYASQSLIFLADRSTISGNLSIGSAGGIAVSGRVITASPLTKLFTQDQPSLPANLLPNLVMQGQSSITGNRAITNGGGLTLVGSLVGLSDEATISGNEAGENGGGVTLSFLGDPSYFELTDHSTVTGNTAASTGTGSGGGLFSDDSSNEVIGGERITSNDPDNCVGSASASCVALP